jgi:hypothetical protein
MFPGVRFPDFFLQSDDDFGLQHDGMLIFFFQRFDITETLLNLLIKSKKRLFE